MICSRKKIILSLFFIISGFILFSPKSSLAGDIYCNLGGCDGEVLCGETYRKECDTCCSTCTDEEGNEYSCNCHSCCPCCTQHRCSGSWTQYRATTEGCEPVIQRRTCRSVCSGDGEDCCSCGGCKIECGVWEDHTWKVGGVETCEECQSWQRAERENCLVTEWNSAKPKCVCSGCKDGECCVDAPTGLEIYQSPNSSIPADSPAKLPIKLDWEDVPGFWSGGWSGGGSTIQDYAECQRGYIGSCWDEAHNLFEEYKETHPNAKFCQGEWTDEYLVCLRRETKENCENLLQEDEACGKTCPALEEGGDECYDPDEFVKSYKIEITGDLRSCDDGSDMNGDTAVLGVSEFFAPCPCYFKSNRTYTWKVQACCTTDGSNCGPWSEPMTFKTSLAPELISPEDPDWAGPDRAEPAWKAPTVENPYPVRLEWCPVEEAKSYCLRFYKPGTPFIRMYGQGEPFCPILYSSLYCPAVVPPSKDFPIQTYFDFGLDVFTKETDYQWKVSTCLNQEGQKCGLSCSEDKLCYTFETLKSECGCCDFSQLWNFFGHVGLYLPELISPKDGEFVNFSHAFKWAHVPGANSYRYEIKRGSNSSVIINEAIVEEYIPIKDLWDKGILALNTQYKWHIQPCWDQEGKDCEEKDGEKVWSAEWSFTVSGAPPKELQVDATIIPVKLDWEDVPGVLTYYYEVAKNAGFSDIVIPEGQRVLKGNISEVLVDYPYLVQNTDYYWRIKTCIDEKGEVCGNWSGVKNFTTFKLGKPTEPYPSDGSEFYTYERYLKWKEVPGARAYQYEVYAGVKTIPLTKVPANSAYVDTPRELGVGEHAWRVRACLDENCEEVGDFSDDWHFTVVEAEPPSGEAGLVPCGRDVNFPDPYGIDETERCGFQHVFLLLRNILDLALWRIGLIILVLLALASGIIFYFSGQFGLSDPLFQVKSLWKAAGIGYLIIFSAYTLVNIFLAIFGYKVGVFGPWWVIKF